MTEKKVLIIDDDRLIGLTLEREFSSFGIQTVIKTEGASGFNKFMEDEFDFIFLDIHLPDTNGLDLLSRIKQVSPHTNVVIMSADLNDENRERALIAGTSAFLEKPFSLAEVKKLAKGIFLGHIEKRKSPRRPCCNLPIKGSIVEIPTPGHAAEPKVFQVKVMDFTTDGLGIESGSSIRKGKHLKPWGTEKDHPLSKYWEQNIRAEVIWVQIQDTGIVAGLKFLT